ncbi:lamin tail domain-containing protein, partial [uncultured Fibrobacter sp.]|uniref:lamin tail domain-containing protein n=1 Tax=uncultured Fibrobacter sp. TaxID=261512 RepID=UPI00261B4C58
MCRDVFIGRALLAVFLVALFSACSDDSSSSSKEPEADVPVDSTEQQGNAIEEHRLSFVGGPVAFTEVDPINVVYEDHEGDDAGWVELYNTSADTVDLSGMYLTDSQTEPFKWKFGTVKLAPNSFLVVFMSGKNYSHQLDAKNRMRIPAKFREELGAGYYISAGVGGCL